MENLPEVLTRLTTRIDALEDRVFFLEHPSEVSIPILPPAHAALQIEVPQAGEDSSFSQAGATFAVLGRAMLGMAGAYLLRAVAESGSFPKLATVALAIAYAGMWLIWAVRVPAAQWFASTTYAATSALILAPMLWELTLRFDILSPAASAAVLAVFLLAAFALAWKRNLTPVVWVVAVATAVTAIALSIATHDLPPFLAVLLLMALLSELAALSNRWLRVRPVAAAAADIAVWALISIYSSAASSRPDYPILNTGALLAPAILLLLIYGMSIALRTVLLRRTIAWFEMCQAVIAFLLAAGATLYFAPPLGAILFATLCLLLSPACYAAVFLCFDALAERRNYHVYATWSAALLLVGCFLALSSWWIASCLAVAAILAMLAGIRTPRLPLAYHGLLFLLAAAFASGLLQYAFHTLGGDFPSSPPAIVWLVAAAVVLFYALSGGSPQETSPHRLFHTLAATLAVGAVAATLISALVALTATVITPGASHVAVVRTLCACALALALATLGPRLQRVELVWAAYALLALVAVKLLFEDLRQGHPEFIAASIFLFAVSLILVPQLAKKSSKNLPAIQSGSS